MTRKIDLVEIAKKVYDTENVAECGTCGQVFVFDNKDVAWCACTAFDVGSIVCPNCENSVSVRGPSEEVEL